MTDESNAAFAAVAAAITARRTVKQFLPQPVAQGQLAQLIEPVVGRPTTG